MRWWFLQVARSDLQHRTNSGSNNTKLGGVELKPDEGWRTQNAWLPVVMKHDP
jgi:hypothetical protein